MTLKFLSSLFRLPVRPWLIGALCLPCVLGVSAADNEKAKEKARKDPNSPVGTWKWNFTTPSGQTIDSSLKLKMEGHKLAGTFIGRNGHESPIEDASFRNGELSFKVVRERDGQNFTTLYRGKMTGEIITGKFESEWAGEKRTRDWLAKWEPPRARGEGISGTWKWSASFGSRSIETTARFKQEGEKVTGVIIGRRGETKIENGKFKDGKLSFTYTREWQGNPSTSKYTGQLDEEKIVGSVEFPGRDGDPVTRDWEAVRADDQDDKKEGREAGKSVSAAGTWQWTFRASGGQTFEPSIKLKQNADKITGTLVWGENEVPIEDGSIQGDELSFKIIRERDGEKYTMKFAGKVEADTLKGKVDSNWGGADKTYDWEAKRVRK